MAPVAPSGCPKGHGSRHGVNLGNIQFQIPNNRQGLRGKRLVQLNPFQIILSDPCLLASCRNRSFGPIPMMAGGTPLDRRTSHNVPAASG